MDAKAIFAKNLRAALDFKKLTGGDIHRKTGIAVSTVGRIANGINAPDLDTVTALCRATGFQPWQLFVPTFDPSSPPFIPKLTEDERALYDKFRALISKK